MFNALLNLLSSAINYLITVEREKKRKSAPEKWVSADGRFFIEYREDWVDTIPSGPHYKLMILKDGYYALTFINKDLSFGSKWNNKEARWECNNEYATFEEAYNTYLRYIKMETLQ